MWVDAIILSIMKKRRSFSFALLKAYFIISLSINIVEKVCVLEMSRKE
jgi:hypothetical protein